MRTLEPPTGHVYRRDGKRRSTWYAKYRLPDGRQIQKRIGPAWTERGRPAAGYYTKRTSEAWLRAVLDEARRGTLAGLVQTGATFADAAAEFLRYAEQDRTIKPSTLTDYRSIISAHLIPAFGLLRLEDITTERIERWFSGLGSANGLPLSNRTRNKLLVLLNGVFRRAQKAYGLPRNPVAAVERHPERSSGAIDVFSVEEVHALARAAASEQDAAIYLTGAFTGLRRGELVALRWRDVDFAASAIRVRESYAGGALTTPKSGRVRSVPMAPDVAEALACLGQRPYGCAACPRPLAVMARTRGRSWPRALSRAERHRRPARHRRDEARSADTSSSSGCRRGPSTPARAGCRRGRSCACRTCGAGHGIAGVEGRPA